MNYEYKIEQCFNEENENECERKIKVFAKLADEEIAKLEAEIDALAQGLGDKQDKELFQKVIAKDDEIKKLHAQIDEYTKAMQVAAARINELQSLIDGRNPIDHLREVLPKLREEVTKHTTKGTYIDGYQGAIDDALVAAGIRA